jgi:CRISPR-associated protein Cmr4
VRSLRGVWIYATSPHLLGYLATYLDAAGRQVNQGLRRASPGTTSTDRIIVKGDVAVLNEEDVKVKVDRDLTKRVFGNLLPQQLLRRVEERGLVVLDDDSMRRLARRSMLRIERRQISLRSS